MGGAEGGLYFPKKSHYYCPANLWLAPGENLPAEWLPFLLPYYALLIGLWTHHPLCATAVTQQQKTTYTVYSMSVFGIPTCIFTQFYENFQLRSDDGNE